MALAWDYRTRGRDPWTRIAVTGLFARLALYHQAYDDVFAIPAAAVLLGFASRQDLSVERRLAALLLGVVNALVLLLPISLFYEPPPWTGLFAGAHTALVAGMLLCLVTTPHPAPHPIPEPGAARSGCRSVRSARADAR